MPLANHISGPIGNSQSGNDNSTHVVNTTTWAFITDNNISVTNDFKHLPSFSISYGSNYDSQDDINFNDIILNSVDYYGDISMDNNSTNDSCHNSNLGSLVGKNSVKRIPARVWLTISWIVTMCSIGRFDGST